MVLKGIPSNISPELLKVLAEMGHGDEIVIADVNFPGASNAKRLIRQDGNNIPELLDSIMQLFPLDQYEPNVVLMAQEPEDCDMEIPIWLTYEETLVKYDDYKIKWEWRNKFYDRAKKAYAVVTTSEPSLYANIILKKGIIKCKN